MLFSKTSSLFPFSSHLGEKVIAFFTFFLAIFIAFLKRGKSTLLNRECRKMLLLLIYCYYLHTGCKFTSNFKLCLSYKPRVTFLSIIVMKYASCHFPQFNGYHICLVSLSSVQWLSYMPRVTFLSTMVIVYASCHFPQYNG